MNVNHRNPTTTVISCYSPTNISEEEDVTDFYRELSNFNRLLSKHNIVIIAGDFNAHLGLVENNKFTFHNITNRNGDHLEDFISEKTL